MTTYKQSGVDIEAGDAFVERIKPYAARTMRPEVVAGVGGFGGLFALPPGCAFAPRCPKADDLCRRERPTYDQKQPGHWAACWHTNG